MRLALIAMSTVLALSGAAPARAQTIDFGDDSGEFARDGQCDDRRFRGATMANILGITEIGRDATDCQRGYEAGVLELWQPGAAQAATDCAVISFGDDSSSPRGPTVIRQGRPIRSMVANLAPARSSRSS
jgi:hypothetical protein